MKILLITSNATIEKLLVLSAQKKGDDVIIGSFEDLPDEEIKAIFIDKDAFDGEKFNNLKFIYKDVKYVLILSKKDEKIEGFDEYLYKPFLPMDVINLLEAIKNDNLVKDEIEKGDIENELNNNEALEILNEDNFDIENIKDKNNVIDEFPDIEETKEDLKILEAKEEFLEDGFEITKEDLEKEAFDKTSEEEFEIDENELREIEEELKDIENLEIESNDNVVEKGENYDVVDSNLNEKNDAMIDFDDMKDMDEEDAIALLDENESLEDKKFEDVSKDKESIENTKEIVEDKKSIENLEKDEKKIIEENEVKKENIESVVLENDKKEDSDKELDIDYELKQIDETVLAKALGEDIEKKEVKEEKILENNKNEENKIDEKEDKISIEEKTLSSILNINWEELKRAKAKITITIDFGE